jgi:hypothetical protein
VLLSINQHIGQESLANYANKVAEIHLSDPPEETRYFLLNLVGHWVSALYVLTAGGISGPNQTSPEFGIEPEAFRTMQSCDSLLFQQGQKS